MQNLGWTHHGSKALFLWYRHKTLPYWYRRSAQTPHRSNQGSQTGNPLEKIQDPSGAEGQGDNGVEIKSKMITIKSPHQPNSLFCLTMLLSLRPFNQLIFNQITTFHHIFPHCRIASTFPLIRNHPWYTRDATISRSSISNTSAISMSSSPDTFLIYSINTRRSLAV